MTPLGLNDNIMEKGNTSKTLTINIIDILTKEHEMIGLMVNEEPYRCPTVHQFHKSNFLNIFKNTYHRLQLCTN